MSELWVFLEPVSSPFVDVLELHSAQSETISHSVITCRMKSRVCLALCKLTSDFLLTLSLTTPFMNPS